MRSLDALQSEIGEWAAETFPGSPVERVVGTAYHLQEEVEELLPDVMTWSNGNMPGWDSRVKNEAADCVILLLNIAHFMGFSLSEAVLAKHAVNLRRKWQAPDDRGVCRHKEVA